MVRHAATTMIQVTRTNVEAELCQSCTDFKDASMYHMFGVFPFISKMINTMSLSHDQWPMYVYEGAL